MKRVGVVGATGLVGQTFLQILEQRKFPISKLKLFASESSVGQKTQWGGTSYFVETLQPDCFNDLDFVFFSGGDDIATKYAPLAVSAGAWVIDNSAAFRLRNEVPLVVPEVNGSLLSSLDKPQIIANPNCTTVQLVIVLNALKPFGIMDVKVSSYQSVSGAGLPALGELQEQRKNPSTPARVFPHQIVDNCIPQIGVFNEWGDSAEEQKMVNETRKILGLPKLNISCFAVRVPVSFSHSEAVWVTLSEKMNREEFLSALLVPGVHAATSSSEYPLQMMATGRDEVFVGRIHADQQSPTTWKMWIVADNLRKGAALNAIQIAESLLN